MDIIQIYAIAAGGTFSVFVLVHLLPHVIPLLTPVSLFLSKHLTYPYLIHRHRVLGPWSRACVAIQLTYLAVNLFCVLVDLSETGFRVSTFSGAGRRAGTLAVVNGIPLFAGPHLAFLADRLGLSVKATRGIHRSAGFMTGALLLLHALVAASNAPLPLNVPRNLFAVIGASSFCLLLLLVLPLFRRPSYELFLRSHQLLALASAYAVWRHLPSDKPFPRGYIYISAGLFAFMFLLQGGSVIVQNGVLRHHLSRATIMHDSGAVKMQVHLQKPLMIHAGQYINLWIPSISFWSFLQSHPFTVISWAAKGQDTLDLLIEPQRGLTRELLYHAKKGYTINPIVMFSGPHGANVSMDGYESVLMVASGFGIAAQLPHLKKLIYGYNTRVVRARRIHLVWQIKSKADGLAAQAMLNSALEEDKLDDGCILSISVYIESSNSPKMPFGERATAYPGLAPMREIFLAELSGKHVKIPVMELTNSGEKTLKRTESEIHVMEGDVESGRTTARDGKMLVAVSGSGAIRDELRMLAGTYLQVGVDLVELDYQPK